MESRTSAKNITELRGDEIFVFGSNESGIHGAGAAKTALKWGARWGQASGLQGNTYGIPTVKKNIAGKLPLESIGRHVDTFIDFARRKQNLVFLVTEIGCGLAGWTVKDIAPLFSVAKDIENIHLPKSFWKELK